MRPQCCCGHLYDDHDESDMALIPGKCRLCEDCKQYRDHLLPHDTFKEVMDDGDHQILERLRNSPTRRTFQIDP